MVKTNRIINAVVRLLTSEPLQDDMLTKCVRETLQLITVAGIKMIICSFESESIVW